MTVNNSVFKQAQNHCLCTQGHTLITFIARKISKQKVKIKILKQKLQFQKLWLL